MRISFDVEYGRTSRSFRPRTAKNDLAIILLASFAIRAAFFCGYGIGDDAAYASEVNNILTEGYHDIGPGAVFLLRPILLGSVAGSVWIFGWSETAFVLPILVASMVGIASAYLIADQLFGRTAAILSACVLSLFPMDLVNSTTLTNDILGSSFLALGAALILRARRRGSITLAPSFLGGLLMGLSVAVKLNYLIAILPLTASLLIGMIRGAVRRSAAGLVLSGWLASQAVIALFCWIKAGHPLAFITYEMDFNRAMMDRHYRPELLSETMLYYPRMMFRLDDHGYGYDVFPLGWFFPLAFGTLFLCLMLRPRGLLLPSGWFLFLVLAMQFWPIQWAPYVPVHRLPRFLHIAAIPGAILIGGTFGRILQKPRVRRSMVIVPLSVYAVASLVQSYRASALHNDCMADPRLLADFVDWYDGPVFTDPELHYYLRFANGFSDVARFRTPITPFDDVWDGSLVIVGGSRKAELAPDYSVPPEPAPREWVRIFQLKTPLGRCRTAPAMGYVARQVNEGRAVGS
jgi:4-amino-4-deoxy-L-arabinose transferase-like glycosyltransferase